ncbi:sensor histidine kinase [Streptomyces sp. NBC_01465]|uniref:sensor histidine kinase n=1 Tax=Streptomyces sp. NBC_01465 TaxID=2903878 RepID=UPI002E37789E|nr:histidine kinase [Streptomyces sp. NBC_01465]
MTDHAPHERLSSRLRSWARLVGRTLVGETEQAPGNAGRAADVALALACGVLSTLALDSIHQLGLVTDHVTSVVITWGVAATLLLRRTYPEICVAAAVAATLASDDRTPLFFAAYALTAYGRRWRWTWVAVAAAGYFAIREFALPHTPADRLPVFYVNSAILLPALFGETVRRHRAAMVALRAQARLAHAAVTQAADLAVLEERTRIAQQTHDELGHRLTALTLQATALRQDVAGDEKLSERASAIEESARGAMAGVREALDMMRDPAGHGGSGEGLDFSRFLASLARNMRATGMEVRHEVHGDLSGLDPEDVTLLRRAGREGLTNAAKYARGADVTLRLAAEGEWIRLDVENGPAGLSPVVADSGGMGLSGLRTAVTAAGGRLSAGPAAGGGHLLSVALPDRRGAG